MPKVAPDDRANSMSESKPRPYAPSWIDRFTAWVARLPGPSWLYYLGIGLVLLLVMAIVLWIEGALPVGDLLPAHLVMPGMIALLLALLHLLGNRADAALTALRPALEASEEEYDGLRYQLTTLPARPTLLASLAAVAIIILLEAIGGRPSSFEPLAKSPISESLAYFVYMIGYWIFGALVYYTVRQLSLIDRIYTKHTCINLFRMRPLYAFSKLTALTAVSLAIPTYVWTALNPASDVIAIGILLLITTLVVAAFVWPLLGVHRLLVGEKERLLDEAALRFEASIVELQQRMDSGNLEGMDDLYKAIAGLEIQRNALDRIPTWPWQPETVRWLVTALLLPLALWLIQFVLQRILGS
jgi:hypothetical protein